MKKKSNLEKWAEKEIELVCDNDDFSCESNYYETALTAFKDICDNTTSRFYLQAIKHILNKLIDGVPLSPIKDTDDIWRITFDHGGYKIYQCQRMATLRKHIYPDGCIKYTDDNYCYCVSDDNQQNRYTLKLAENIIYEMFPIIMPYIPSEPIKIYCSEFISDSDNNYLDVVGILYAVKPDGSLVNINRYFKEDSSDSRYSGWVEISETEYKKWERLSNETSVE